MALYKEILLMLTSEKHILKVLILLIGPASKSNFWQFFYCAIYGNLTDFEIEHTSFYY